MAGLRNVYFAFVFIASGGLLFGYIIGVSSNVVTTGQLICADGESTDATWTSVGYQQCYKLNSLQQGFLSSVNLIGACLSSLFCFRYGDTLGRKLEVQIGAVLYLIGAVMAAASPNLVGICCGFAVYGLGVGFAMHAAPVYIAEVSPANIRGTLVSAKEAVIVLGIFLGYFFGWLFHDQATIGWRAMVAISAAFAFIMGVGIAFIPQSPRFLVLQAVRSRGLLGQGDSFMRKAGESLKFYRQAASADEVEEELETMRTDIAASVGTEVAKATDAFKYPRPLKIGCGLVFLQQVTGQPSVLYLATNIFKSAGFGQSAALSSVGVGLVKLLATLFTVWRVDSYGRKFLLFIGIGMMTAALAVIGTAFLFRECQAEGISLANCEPSDIGLPKGWAYATVGGLMVYVSGYQVGFGPIAWLMISEVFPLKVRGAAMSVAAMVNFSFNILMTLTQQVLQDILTPSGVFFGYLVMCIVSIVFVIFVVPETKGKTLEQIEVMLTGSKGRSLEVATSEVQRTGAA